MKNTILLLSIMSLSSLHAMEKESQTEGSEGFTSQEEGVGLKMFNKWYEDGKKEDVDFIIPGKVTAQDLHNKAVTMGILASLDESFFRKNGRYCMDTTKFPENGFRYSAPESREMGTQSDNKLFFVPNKSNDTRWYHQITHHKKRTALLTATGTGLVGVGILIGNWWPIGAWWPKR